eukprot:CAMPEP_0202712566 /NCGR_PEP_ID=MMETSP1385-20130828/43303_1 /ASSEMBLY_ACC=CAM_ASM_000861 /TAXON_ID=933848 /ORGANISM="Elphidium margaritaceum" /LENGTH=65 /DNA_ID=CAMNT_0049372651 /DNA_START=32 /DNA_END=226 /DNA_ORIENTATION=+
MSTVKRKRGNAKQRLQRLLKEQRLLEDELEQLNAAASQKESAQAILKHVENNGVDPMTLSGENNW